MTFPRKTLQYFLNGIKPCATAATLAEFWRECNIDAQLDLSPEDYLEFKAEVRERGLKLKQQESGCEGFECKDLNKEVTTWICRDEFECERAIRCPEYQTQLAKELGVECK